MSLIAIVEKTSHSQRIYIDLKVLKRALKQKAFQIANSWRRAKQTKKAMIVIKCGVSSAFLHVKLDEPSRKLTTTITRWDDIVGIDSRLG